jgi:TonB family protein
MKPFYILLFIFGLFITESAQAKKDTTIIYCDADIKKVKADRAGYYAKVFKNQDGTTGVLHYRVGGSLCTSGSFKSKKLKIKQGAFVYYHTSGKPKQTGTFLNDLATGTWKYITNDGIVTAEGENLAGKRTGKWLYKNKEGKKTGITFYKEGKNHGEYLRWENDTLIEQGRYDMDKKVGDWKKWYTNGNKDSEGAYIAGERNGEWKFYHKSGQISARENYLNGEAISAEWFNENGESIETDSPLEQEPEFPGGQTAMNEFILNNINYPEYARENSEQGIIYTQFYIQPDGSLTDIKIRKGVSETLDKEAMRVVRKMPKWTPAINHGRDYPTLFTLPFHFRLG